MAEGNGTPVLGYRIYIAFCVAPVQRGSGRAVFALAAQLFGAAGSNVVVAVGRPRKVRRTCRTQLIAGLRAIAVGHSENVARLARPQILN